MKIYRTIILCAVLYGCETWSLTSKEERRLRVFENRVLRAIFGPKRDEVIGEWRKLHNEVLNDLHCSRFAVSPFSNSCAPLRAPMCIVSMDVSNLKKKCVNLLRTSV